MTSTEPQPAPEPLADAAGPAAADIPVSPQAPAPATPAAPVAPVPRADVPVGEALVARTGKVVPGDQWFEAVRAADPQVT